MLEQSICSVFLRGKIVRGVNQVRLLVLAAIIAISIAASAAFSFRSQTQIGSVKKQERHITDLERWPVADYSAPVDPKERATRQARNKKYDKRIWPINP